MRVLKELHVTRTLIEYDVWSDLTFEMKYYLYKGYRIVFINRKRCRVLYELKKKCKDLNTGK